MSSSLWKRGVDIEIRSDSEGGSGRRKPWWAVIIGVMIVVTVLLVWSWNRGGGGAVRSGGGRSTVVGFPPTSPVDVGRAGTVRAPPPVVIADGGSVGSNHGWGSDSHCGGGCGGGCGSD